VNPDQAFGGQPSSWVPKMSTFLNTQGCLQQSVVITPKWLPFVGEESSTEMGAGDLSPPNSNDTSKV